MMADRAGAIRSQDWSKSEEQGAALTAHADVVAAAAGKTSCRASRIKMTSGRSVLDAVILISLPAPFEEPVLDPLLDSEPFTMAPLIETFLPKSQVH
jgi:hypothetical protein